MQSGRDREEWQSGYTERCYRTYKQKRDKNKRYGNTTKSIRKEIKAVYKE